MTVTRNTHYLAHLVHFTMSDLPSTPQTCSGCQSLLPIARNTAGHPTLCKKDQEELLLDHSVLLVPSVASPSPVPIDPAMFQQQMLNVMTLLAGCIPGQRTHCKITSASTHNFSKAPKAKDPETFNGNQESLTTFSLNVSLCSSYSRLALGTTPQD